jgi:hypothetical protein
MNRNRTRNKLRFMHWNVLDFWEYIMGRPGNGWELTLSYRYSGRNRDFRIDNYFRYKIVYYSITFVERGLF